MKNITVIGGGATGVAAAAHMTLLGNKVTLFETNQNYNLIEEISNNKTIYIKGPGLDKKVIINQCTNNPEIAMKDAEIIIVAVIAQRHQEIIDICGRYLNNNQIIVITPGNLGSLVFYNTIKRNKYELPLLLEVESNLYVCKKTSRDSVELIIPVKARYVSTFPGKYTNDAIKKLEDIYELYPASNILETTLNLPNIDCHLAGCLLNVGSIEKGEFCFYKDGLTEPVLKCIEIQYEEKTSIMKKIGCTVRTTLDLLYKINDEANYPKLKAFREIKGPKDISHRYITEEAFAGISIISSLGEMLNIKTPTTDSLLYIASIINNYDYINKGRTCKNLGIDKFSKKQLIDFLNNGNYN